MEKDLVDFLLEKKVLERFRRNACSYIGIIPKYERADREGLEYDLLNNIDHAFIFYLTNEGHFFWKDLSDEYKFMLELNQVRDELKV